MVKLITSLIIVLRDWSFTFWEGCIFSSSKKLFAMRNNKNHLSFLQNSLLFTYFTKDAVLTQSYIIQTNLCFMGPNGEGRIKRRTISLPYTTLMESCSSSIESFIKHYSNEIAHTILVVNCNTMCRWKKNKYYIYESSPLFPVTLKLIKLIMKKTH